MAEIIVYFIMFLLFMFFSTISFLFYYKNRENDLKHNKNLEKNRTFSDFKNNNKYKIIIFSSYLFLIIAIAFLVLFLQLLV